MYENDSTEVYDFFVPNFYSDDYSTSDFNELDSSSDTVLLGSDISGNDVDLSGIDSSLSEINQSLKSIKQTVTNLVMEDVPSSFSESRAISVDYIDAYYFRFNNQYVYVPYDKIDYFTLANDGELLNISSQTISCYSLDTNGNVLEQYRFQPFSKCQRYVYGYDGQSYQHWYWQSEWVTSQGSNMTFGQTGIAGIENFLLFGILFFVGIIALFRKGK